MIKISTLYSKPGGSTEVLISLTNALNKAGYETIMYGPHDYHTNRCSGVVRTPDNIKIRSGDTVISHLWTNSMATSAKKWVYTSHEHEVRPVNMLDLTYVDAIHYVSEHQKEWHNVDHSSFVIPNYVDNIKPKADKIRAAGVVGLILPQKKTHLSIQKALDDGHKMVYVFGAIDDQNYFDYMVAPMFKDKRVHYIGHMSDKQGMYDSFTDLYISSERETFSLVIAEAMKAGITVCAPDNVNYVNCNRIFDNDKITEMWVEELGL